jgi:hypothetical protein
MTKELKQNNKIRRLSLYALSIGEAYAGASIAEQEQTLREFADGNDFDSAIMYKAGMCYLQQINRDYEEIRDWVECSADLMATSPQWFWDSIEKEAKQYSNTMYNFKTKSY